MNVCNIVEHGAVPDGKTNSAQAFARAIEACTNDGGGRVIVPRGAYLTGPIQLKSNVELHLERNARVLFSTDYADYPLVITDFEGLETVRCVSPISGENLDNVAITGAGSFDGQGEVW